MGFEVFDDVAFYFLMQSLLAVFIVPPTVFVIVREFYRLSKRDADAAIIKANRESEGKITVDKMTWLQRLMQPKYLLFVFLWVVFLFNCSQYGHYQTATLASFDPPSILGVEPDATDGEIKKAYRALSLKWHPDKNQDNREEAENKFITISKAYKALTDPKSKENMKKYGNVDGFQGNSVTIGLPSFLTNEDNHLKVLLVYFLLMIATPPICVFLWWRRASKVHEWGVMRESLAIFAQFITEHMSAKSIIPVLAAAAEFQELEKKENDSAQKESDRKKLTLQVRDFMVNSPMLKRKYIARGTVLIHAYLLRIPIPVSLQGELALILKHAHGLLGAMFTVCMSPGPQGRPPKIKAAMACVSLMQHLTQAMWPGDSPLLQLPFLTHKEIRLANKKKMDNLEAFKAADQDLKEKAYDAHSKQEWDKINQVSDMLPSMRLECDTVVKDEEGIFEGDIVTVTVTLQRLKPAEREEASKTIMEGDNEQASDEEDAKTATEEDGKIVEETEGEGDDEDNENDDPEVDEAELALLDTLPTAERESRFGKEDHGNVVHSSFYPYPKHEKWVVLLFQKAERTLRLIGVKKVGDFRDSEKVEFLMRVTEKGTMPYEVHAKCDSYVGCDVSLTFKITTKKMTQADEERREQKYERGKEFGLDDDEEEDTEGEYEGKWYYAGFESIWELLLNLFVLGLLGIFVVNFLQTRGYWDKWFQPPIDNVMGIVMPVFRNVYAVLSPVLGPIVGVMHTVLSFLYNLVNVDTEEYLNLHRDL